MSSFPILPIDLSIKIDTRIGNDNYKCPLLTFIINKLPTWKMGNPLLLKI